MHRAMLDGNAKLAEFSKTLERTVVETVESGDMTKDLAILVGPDQSWLSTLEFLDKIQMNFEQAMK